MVSLIKVIGLMIQVNDLECEVSYDETKSVVWECGMKKSLGPDGFTFELFFKFWSIIDKDVVTAVKAFLSLDINHKLYQCGHNEENLSQRSTLLKDLHDVDSIEALEIAQKAKIHWPIKRDENS
nr:RNA-directed DNA polymerase, eukaryota, reverse transcriptase zinc-binding domain protein [Tanacetum cinerariifolium]